MTNEEFKIGDIVRFRPDPDVPEFQTEVHTKAWVINSINPEYGGLRISNIDMSYSAYIGANDSIEFTLEKIEA